MTPSMWKVCDRRYHEEWNTTHVRVQACDFADGQDSAAKPKAPHSSHSYNPIFTEMVVQSDICPKE